jgi:hypothetical protein
MHPSVSPGTHERADAQSLELPSPSPERASSIRFGLPALKDQSFPFRNTLMQQATASLTDHEPWNAGKPQ